MIKKTEQNNRAFSSVIGSALTVALVVILATFVGITVYEMYQEADNTPYASVTFDQTGTIRAGYDVTVTADNFAQAERLILEDSTGTELATLTKPGQQHTETDLEPGDQITVIAEFKDKSRVIEAYEVKRQNNV